MTVRVNPQKKNILIQRLSHAPWWLLAMALLVLWFAATVSDKYPYPIVYDAVKQGIKTTIWVSVAAYALALVLGLIVALLRRSSNAVVYQAVTFYVEVVRGIPTLVLVFYMSLALVPQVIEWINNIGFSLDNLRIVVHFTSRASVELTFERIGSWLLGLTPRKFDNTYRAIMALAISYSAFLSEIFRAGIDSIGVGQREAARSLGMTRWQTMYLIVLPQAIRVILPPLGNDFIAMLKESSLVSVLGVKDITRRGQTYGTSTFAFFPMYNVIALTYLVLTVSLSMLVKLMEIYLNRGRQHEGSS